MSLGFCEKVETFFYISNSYFKRIFSLEKGCIFDSSTLLREILYNL